MRHLTLLLLCALSALPQTRDVHQLERVELLLHADMDATRKADQARNQQFCIEALTDALVETNAISQYRADVVNGRVNAANWKRFKAAIRRQVRAGNTAKKFCE